MLSMSILLLVKFVKFPKMLQSDKDPSRVHLAILGLFCFLLLAKDAF